MSRKARVYVDACEAGYLEELEKGTSYRFSYVDGYSGAPVSLTMPISQQVYEFNSFPAFFDGLLPEGVMLEALLKRAKVNRDDLFSQLIIVGQDLSGWVTVEAA